MLNILIKLKVHTQARKRDKVDIILYAAEFLCKNTTDDLLLRK